MSLSEEIKSKNHTLLRPGTTAGFFFWENFVLVIIVNGKLTIS